MGPAKLRFQIAYEDKTVKFANIHISKDQDEADGMIMAVRCGKDENPYSPLKAVEFIEVFEDE